MLQRLGFTGRVMVIILLALLALSALGAGWAYVSQSPGSAPQLLLPLPNQANAIVELLEANATRQSLVLRAVNSDTLSVTVTPERPLVPTGARRLPSVEWLATHYAPALASRDVIAFISSQERPGWRKQQSGRDGFHAPDLLRLAVSLSGGGYVVFETHGDLSRRVLGLPPGFWMGALGSLVGIATILAIMREARPLRELSDAIAGFAGKPTPVAVRARGAPEIRKLIGAVNDMQARIAALVEGRTVLIAALSHDLKTYITRLRLRAEMIADDTHRDRAVLDLEDMTTLVDDALAVAGGGAAKNLNEPLNIVELIRADCADRPQNAVEILHTEEMPTRADGDPVALRRLFGNLIDNALRYGHRCRVTVTQQRGFAVIFVDDDGPGIPPAEQIAVFVPFYRLEPSRNRATGGSGLGLAIAKQIVESHSGAITVEASPFGGARLKVAIPAVISSREPSRTAKQQAVR
jgi:two-component system osmolarity sensor histidine kinase EnvZ